MGFSDDKTTARWTTPSYKLYRYITSAYQDTGWNNRVIRWGQINREAQPFGAEFRIADMTLDIADHDFGVYGSFSNSYVNLLGQNFLVTMQFSPTSNAGTLFIGRCTSIENNDLILSLHLQDLIQQIKNRKTIWSYYGITPSAQAPIYAITKIGSLYGGTKFISGPGNCIITADSGSLVVAGDTIKFDVGVLDTDRGLALKERLEYNVSEWGTVGSSATMVLDKPVVDAIIGNYIYKQQTLVRSGNPGQIIYDILTGTNIDIPFVDSDFDKSEWGSGTSIYASWTMSGTINSRSPLDAIHEICESSMSSLTSNSSNQIVWSAYRPRDTQTFSVDHYHATTSILNGFSWSISEENIARNVQINYGHSEYNLDVSSSIGLKAYHVPDTKDFGNAGYVLRVSDGTIGEAKTVDTNWITEPEDAAILAGRMIAYSKRSIPISNIPTTAFGITATPLDFIKVTHPVGSLGTNLMQVVSVRQDLDNLKTSISAIDMTQVLLQKGYAFWTSGTREALVTGTSLGGFGTTGTVHNINTSLHGSIFRVF